MKTYYVEYTFRNPWGNYVSDRRYCKSEEDATDFIKRVCEAREVTDLTLITYDKIIGE